MNITLKQAEKVIRAAKEKSTQIGSKIDTAIIDANAIFTAFVRIDGAKLGSVDIDISKVKTAHFFYKNIGRMVK